ncbi:unnamed protein product, partial [Iphiclides podalirius]
MSPFKITTHYVHSGGLFATHYRGIAEPATGGGVARGWARGGRRGARERCHYRDERAHTITMTTEAQRRVRPWVALQWNGEGISPVLHAAISPLAKIFGGAFSALMFPIARLDC